MIFHAPLRLLHLHPAHFDDSKIQIILALEPTAQLPDSVVSQPHHRSLCLCCTECPRPSRRPPCPLSLPPFLSLMDANASSGLSSLPHAYLLTGEKFSALDYINATFVNTASLEAGLEDFSAQVRARKQGAKAFAEEGAFTGYRSSPPMLLYVTEPF